MMVYLKYFLNKISDILDSKNSPNNQCKTSLQKITKKTLTFRKPVQEKKQLFKIYVFFAFLP